MPEYAVRGARAGIGVEQTGWNQYVFGGVDLVRNACSALRAERHREAFGTRQIEALHQRLAGEPFELRRRDKCVRRVRAAGRFLAAAAVAVAKRRERWRDFESNRTAQAAAADCFG